MSRAIKVPEDLYGELQREADQNDVTLMEALQRRLRNREAELESLRLSRDTLRQSLAGVQTDLARASRSDSAHRTVVSRLEGEGRRLRQDVAAQAHRIAELEEAAAVTHDESESLRMDRDEARQAAQTRSSQLQATLICLGVGLVAWIAWQWWKEHGTPVGAEPTPEPAEPAWMMRL